jgi:hypothetical protein
MDVIDADFLQVALQFISLKSKFLAVGILSHIGDYAYFIFYQLIKEFINRLSLLAYGYNAGRVPVVFHPFFVLAENRELGMLLINIIQQRLIVEGGKSL